MTFQVAVSRSKLSPSIGELILLQPQTPPTEYHPRNAVVMIWLAMEIIGVKFGFQARGLTQTLMSTKLTEYQGRDLHELFLTAGLDAIHYLQDRYEDMPLLIFLDLILRVALEKVR